MFDSRPADQQNDDAEYLRQLRAARIRSLNEPGAADRIAQSDKNFWDTQGRVYAGAPAASINASSDQAIAALKDRGDTGRNAASIAGNLEAVDRTQTGETARTGMTEQGLGSRNAATITGNLAGIDKQQAGETARTNITDSGATSRNAATIAGNLQGIDKQQEGETGRTRITTGSNERIAVGNQATQQRGDTLQTLGALGRPNPLTGEGGAPRGLLETLAARGGVGTDNWGPDESAGTGNAAGVAVGPKPPVNPTPGQRWRSPTGIVTWDGHGWQ